jgi:ubiquitin carboxyl-terminal hydrolase BAP1
MSTEWYELESDPGLFTLLMRDFGVKGVEVEEIYDLGQEIEGSVYGFIFLANWTDDGNWRRRNAGRDVCSESGTFVEEAETVNNMFFAHQVVTNACATYALLSVLLNCPNVELGSLLGGVKEFTEGFDPESKGYAIANLPQLKIIHNRHSRPVYPQLNLPVTLKRKRRISIDRTVFHYSSYLPINGCLMELDGLKVAPVNHGPVLEGDGWITAFKSVIERRIGFESG